MNGSRVVNVRENKSMASGLLMIMVHYITICACMLDFVQLFFTLRLYNRFPLPTSEFIGALVIKNVEDPCPNQTEKFSPLLAAIVLIADSVSIIYSWKVHNGDWLKYFSKTEVKSRLTPKCISFRQLKIFVLLTR